MTEAGFGRVDITPRIGVELCGFGPFLNRKSIGIRDRLWAKAMAVRKDGVTAILVSCDLVGVTSEITRRIRAAVRQAVAVPEEYVLVHCTHTHSGPNTIDNLIGWGTLDPPYCEMLPGHIAQACTAAVHDLAAAVFRHGIAPCEGIGLNREYDRDAPPLADILRDDWRPAKPELTDTICHVIAIEKDGRRVGFCSYFSCHPVTCCQETRYIHGDFCGVATNLLEREYPGAVGLFLQGAQGDVNSACVHKPETESLLALDVIAGRYARSVRQALAAAQPMEVDRIHGLIRQHAFTRKQLTLEKLKALLAEREAVCRAPDASDSDGNMRMSVVYAITLRNLIARLQAGQSLEPVTELQGLRLGPVALLASPFEIFQAIKRDVLSNAQSRIPLVLGLSNNCLGYAPDREAAQRGGYAADTVPMMLGQLPFANIHEELARALLALDADLEEGLLP